MSDVLRYGLAQGSQSREILSKDSTHNDYGVRRHFVDVITGWQEHSRGYLGELGDVASVRS